MDLLDRADGRGGVLRAATTMSGGKRAIKERVTRIAKAPRSRVAAAALVLALVFAVSACTFTGALRGEAVPGQPLRNATVYFNESDCFWSNKTGHFCAFEAEDSRVLALHWKDNRSNMELRLPSGVRDSDGSVGAFMSDEMAAVCCLDGEGGLRAFVNPDRGGAWNEATLNAGSEGQCFIGFSTVSDGWLAYVRAVDPGNPPDYPGARYTAVFWLTDDSGASWVRVPYEQYFAGKPAGFAITADGEAFAAVNYTEGGGEARVLRSQGPGENWNMVSSIGAVTENSPIPAGSEGGFSARPVYISNDGVVYTYAKQSVEYSGEVSRGSLTEGFWRIPGGKEGAVNSTELADGALRLAQVANEDYDGEYVRSFWARYSVTGRAVGGDIAAWAALTTESGSLSVTAAPVYVRGDGALVCSGEGYGTFTLTPECVLMFPLYDTGQGQPQIGVAAVTGEGERAYIGFGMDGGEIVCRSLTPPGDTAAGVYIRETTEDFLLGSAGCEVFNGYPEGTDYLVYAALCASETVYELEIFAVDGDFLDLRRGETLYEYGTLSPGRALAVANVSVGENAPGRGFSFRDAGGNYHEYYISLMRFLSGDGVLAVQPLDS